MEEAKKVKLDKEKVKTKINVQAEQKIKWCRNTQTIHQPRKSRRYKIRTR